MRVRIDVLEDSRRDGLVLLLVLVRVPRPLQISQKGFALALGGIQLVQHVASDRLDEPLRAICPSTERRRCRSRRPRCAVASAPGAAATAGSTTAARGLARGVRRWCRAWPRWWSRGGAAAAARCRGPLALLLRGCRARVRRRLVRLRLSLELRCLWRSSLRAIARCIWRRRPFTHGLRCSSRDLRSILSGSPKSSRLLLVAAAADW
mmetsp:Transcript_13228/g.36291  ORF Transcript_13228/g.36291 Transcript_13228/m.36291 type:complete len:207 (+) Transcript_13228:82-702(+)